MTLDKNNTIGVAVEALRNIAIGIVLLIGAAAIVAATPIRITDYLSVVVIGAVLIAIFVAGTVFGRIRGTRTDIA